MNVDEGWWFNKIEEPLEKLVEQERCYLEQERCQAPVHFNINNEKLFKKKTFNYDKQNI